MSSKHDAMKTDPVRQANSDSNSQIDQLRLENYQLLNTLLRIVLVIFTEAVVSRFVKWLDMRSQAATLPESGWGNIKAIAAHLGMGEPGARKLVKRLPNLVTYKPGEEVLYRFSDIATLAKKEIEKPETDAE